MNKYYTAQICLNGHIADAYSNFEETYCSLCGAENIHFCPVCNTEIKGEVEYTPHDIVINPLPYARPNYCYKCGKAFPWTRSALLAASELILEDEALDDSDKNSLIASLSDLTTETPKTKVAVSRFKRVIGKATSTTAECLKGIFVEIAAEVVKKQLWG